MKSENVIKSLLKQFPYEPTSGQKILIAQLSEFILSNDKTSLFVLKGYAGTGKTTIVSSLVNILPEFKKNSILLAPTGRAAKVLSNYSKKQAFTIHKKIYYAKTSKDGNINLVLQNNYHKNTIFIVDEASMIPDNTKSGDFSLFSIRNLLDDLINYVYEGYNCKLLLIGDTAQLPPVRLDISPALDLQFLENNYSNSVNSFELKEVVRQSQNSGILSNATRIRNKIKLQKHEFPFFSLNSFNDILKINGSELEEALNDNYSKFGQKNTVVICRSNKRANIYNIEIRKRILFKEDEISTGDFMMIVKNNYFWLSAESKAGFIANGDIIEILSIRKIYELYSFRFADVIVRMVDYPDEKEFNTKIMLDTIMAETPSLSVDDNRKFFNEVIKDYEDIPRKRTRIEKVKSNPFFNALQVKFAYALTCHKTQGGQWDCVFVDQGYINDQMINVEFMRWLYTALTRATKKLYLINFRDVFYT
ncbi:MAG: AAA family ATPase [Bacteroidales bacterium]|nr:AAA family ATPase [Bacteroidales bacterium]